MADQQYCLRWNNHQTTLISVFESLQERGCMVDCTLAAEGQSLQAHKVVLSACSPYLEDLLSKHYDKHPILLLKDVKFEELKAMMDYMYRGEVNVAQDKLNTFLRAAESLQIKGLSDGGTDPPDSGGTGSMKRTAKGAPVSVRSNQQLTVRTTNLADDNSSRDGSVSPSLRKRRRRRGSDGSDHDNSSNVADGKQSSAAAAPVTGPTVNNEDMLPTVPASGPSDDNLLSSILESTETENATDSGITSANNTVPLQENVIRDRDNVLIEPKTEYLDDDAQDLHLDDDDSMFRAGPSHARGSGNYEGDGEDVYMANQDSGANAQGVASFLRAQGTEVWVEGSAAAAEEEVQEVPQAPALRAPLCRSAASTAVWVQETPRPASRTSTVSTVAAVALKAVPHVAAEVGAEASRDAGPEVSSAVIEVSMDDLEESDVWNALVKDEPDGSEDIEADFEADIEAEVELEEGDADELSSAADESVSPGRLGRRRTYKCRVCRKHMGSMSILQRHMVTHTDEERKQQPFARQCEQCGRVLSSRQRLESHINAVHMQGDKKQSSYVRQSLGCPVCGKVLSSMQRVRSHMATHYRNPMAMPTPPATPLQPAPEDAVFKHVV